MSDFPETSLDYAVVDIQRLVTEIKEVKKIDAASYKKNPDSYDLSCIRFSGRMEAVEDCPNSILFPTKKAILEKANESLDMLKLTIIEQVAHIK